MKSKVSMRSFRLSSEVIEYLDELARKTGKGKTEIVEQAITKAHKAYSASKIWGFGSAEQINLMLSDFPEEANYANPAFEGSVGAIGTLAPAITLANEGKTLTIHMHRFQIDFNGNLLLVGGPKRNRVTKFFLEETALKEEATFDGWKLKFDGNESEALFSDSNGLHILNDYGLLLKAPNPLDTRNTVMIIAGCRAFGTGGAASIVADEKMSEDIVEKLGEDKCEFFKAIVSVLVLNDVIAKRELVDIKPIYFC